MALGQLIARLMGELQFNDFGSVNGTVNGKVGGELQFKDSGTVNDKVDG